MRVLVACEESQTVCKAFRERGHEAYSCDIQDCSGGHPEWHIKGDALAVLNPKWFDLNRDGEGNQWEGIKFATADGRHHQFEGKWDLIIAHPPCTDLSVSGARHFEKKRADGSQLNSILFFNKMLNADCEKICVENPVNIISGKYLERWFPDVAKECGFPLKPSQKIQPFEYGHPYIKTTCLWLKNLPLLKPTNILEKPETGWVNQSITSDGRYGGFNSKFATAKERSKTFEGIAKAMAEQWGDEI